FFFFSSRRRHTRWPRDWSSDVCSSDLSNDSIGYDELAYLTVTKVNGKEIKSLDDLAEAVKHPIEGFIKVETEEDPKQIELDAAQVGAEAQDLQENYGISALHRLN